MRRTCTRDLARGRIVYGIFMRSQNGLGIESWRAGRHWCWWAALFFFFVYCKRRSWSSARLRDVCWNPIGISSIVIHSRATIQHSKILFVWTCQETVYTIGVRVILSIIYYYPLLYTLCIIHSKKSQISEFYSSKS